MSEDTKKAASSINPFSSLYEFARQPYDIVKHFFNHSLDDFAEDAVTAAGVWGYYNFSPAAALSFGFFSYWGAAPVVYYGIKRVADEAGEFFEGLSKNQSDILEDKSHEGYISKFADDVTEDVSKTLCITWNVVKAIGVVEVSRIIYNQNIVTPTAPMASNKWVKLADGVSGVFGGMSTYSDCDELANAHGHFVAEWVQNIFSDDAKYLGDTCPAINGYYGE